MQIKTSNQRFIPIWSKSLIGETLSLKVLKTKNFNKDLEGNNIFSITFTCPKNIYENFIDTIIKPKDILFKDNYYGSIVDKEKGNLYSGGLFVCNLKNLKKSYDIPPQHLSLDRDRRIPGSWEVSYFTSKINEAEGKFNFVDQDYDDTKYITIPQKVYSTIKPVEIKGQIEYIAKVIDEETKEEKEIIITNNNYKEQLKSSSFFSKAINKLKNYIASKLGVVDLLINFRNKYCTSNEAKHDFDIILERLGININKNA